MGRPNRYSPGVREQAARIVFEHPKEYGPRAGLAAAHKRGGAIGRLRALTPEQILMAKAMTADPAISIRQVAKQFGIHRSTLYRHLNARQKRST